MKPVDYDPNKKYRWIAGLRRAESHEIFDAFSPTMAQWLVQNGYVVAM